MRQGDVRGPDRRGSPLGVGPYVAGAFFDRPAIITAGTNPVNHFPSFPADIPDPQIAGRRVKTHPPRVAKPIGINLGPSAVQVDERVIRRDRIAASLVGVIDVDSQNRGVDIADILAVIEHVGRIGRGDITRRDVEHPVVAEGDRAAVVAARVKLQDRQFARHHQLGRLGSRQFEAGDVRAVGSSRAARDDVADHDATIGRKVGMERQTVDRYPFGILWRQAAERWRRGAEVGDQLDLRVRSTGQEGQNLAILLEDQHPIGFSPWQVRHRMQRHGTVEIESRKGVRELKGERRIGRTDDPRRGPRDTPAERRRGQTVGPPRVLGRDQQRHRAAAVVLTEDRLAVEIVTQRPLLSCPGADVDQHAVIADPQLDRLPSLTNRRDVILL